MTCCYDTVVFDLDGTLIESHEGIFRSLMYALGEMGVASPSEQDMRRFIGPPLQRSFVDVLGMSEEDARRATEIYRSRYKDKCLEESAVYTGIPELLARLKRCGAVLAVATGKPQGMTDKILQHFRLAEYFSCIVGTDEKTVTNDKSRLIERVLAGREGRTVMIGDTRFDRQGAKDCGIAFVGAGYGYGTPEELGADEGVPVAADVNGLLALLLEDAPVPRGVFITVEGLDGCGKTTQMNALEQALKRFGYDVLRTREPGGCPVSEKIRDIVLDRGHPEMLPMTEALLYASARAQHVGQIILPALKKGRLVLCDRYVDSSIAYQGGGRMLGMDRVADINAYATGGLLPDISVYLDAGVSAALERRFGVGGADRIEMEPSEFHTRVSDAFEKLIQNQSSRYLVVDARADAESVTRECFKKVMDKLRVMEGVSSFG